MNMEYRVVFWNRAAEAVYGIPAAEAIGQRIDQLVELVSQNISRQEILKTASEQGCWRGEVQHRTRAVDTIWIDQLVSKCDLGGGQSGFLAVIRPIDKYKNREEVLLESEAQFRAMVETIPMAIMVSSGMDLKAEYLNSKFVELFGYTLEDVPTTYAWLELAYPDEEYRRRSFDEWNRRIQESIETGIPAKPMEVVVTCKDGSTKQVAAGYNTLGEKSYAYGLDLTEWKRAEADKLKLEAQLQQAMKMEAVGRLAGGVAHDFNNLLTGIMGNVSLAMMDIRPDEKIAKRLSEVNKASLRAAALTNQLLAFSRKQIIEPRVLDLNEIIVSLQKMLVRLIGENIELKTVRSENLGAVKVDQGQFEQILVNLVVNARDAMPDGGKLAIETANVELDTDYCSAQVSVMPGHYVMLAVSDTGHGMSAEVKSHLFEPFFTTKPQGQGTGLGLATIHGAVLQAGGHIEVHSEEGVGTTFKIYVPRLMDKAVNLNSEGGQPRIKGGTETILLVEDEKIVREVGVILLERLGYKVLQAADGASALKVVDLFTDHIDLLFTDVVMPGMNGRELADQLTAIVPDMKVLFTSGYTEDVIGHHGIVDNGLNFIGKPYRRDDLAIKLRKVLGDVVAD
jgi:PAS domain S-box-containing protein